MVVVNTVLRHSGLWDTRKTDDTKIEKGEGTYSCLKFSFHNHAEIIN